MSSLVCIIAGIVLSAIFTLLNFTGAFATLVENARNPERFSEIMLVAQWAGVMLVALGVGMRSAEKNRRESKNGVSPSAAPGTKKKKKKK